MSKYQIVMFLEGIKLYPDKPLRFYTRYANVHECGGTGFLRRLIKKGFVKTEKLKNRHKISLTEIGNKIAEMMLLIKGKDLKFLEGIYLISGKSLRHYSRYAEVDYSYGSKVLKRLVRYELVNVEKGKTTSSLKISLTEKGSFFAMQLFVFKKPEMIL